MCAKAIATGDRTVPKVMYLQFVQAWCFTIFKVFIFCFGILKIRAPAFSIVKCGSIATRKKEKLFVLGIEHICLPPEFVAEPASIRIILTHSRGSIGEGVGRDAIDN